MIDMSGQDRFITYVDEHTFHNLEFINMEHVAELDGQSNYHFNYYCPVCKKIVTYLFIIDNGVYNAKSASDDLFG